jgi:hypothetical protein
LFNPSSFGLQADRLNVTHLLTNFPFPGNSPARSHRLSTEIKPGELVDLRNIQIDTGSAYDQISSLPLPEFLRRSGFPLKETYLDGDPLTAERGGTIVIDRGRLTTIYPSYFVHRRLIDPQGDLVDIGLDENFGARPLFEVKLRPAVSEHLYRCVSYHGYIPVVRYRSFPYSSEFLLPLLDTPMSDSGWADLFIDPKGFGRLFIAKQKTLAEWTEMLARLRELFYRTLAETDYHLLGLTKDRSRLNRYFGEKQHILEDYYLIQTWRLY